MGWMRAHLVSRVIAGHVAFATVDAHVLVYQSLHLLLIVELMVGPDVLQSPTNYILSLKVHTHTHTHTRVRIKGQAGSHHSVFYREFNTIKEH